MGKSFIKFHCNSQKVLVCVFDKFIQLVYIKQFAGAFRVVILLRGRIMTLGL